MPASIKGIEELLDIMQHYEKCLNNQFNLQINNDLFNECNTGLEKRLKAINSSDLLSVFLLADELGVTHGNTQIKVDIPGILSEEMHHRLVSNLENVNIGQGEFELLHSLKDDVIKTIFTNDDKEALLQKIKKNMLHYYFNQVFNGNPIYYKTSDLMNKITGIFLNADKSRLLYIGFAKEDRSWNDLFIMDVTTGTHSYEQSKSIYLTPCWIDNNRFAYIQYSPNRSNKLWVYDCSLKKTIKEKIIYPDYEAKEHENFKILKMLCSNQKIVFLYHYNFDYGIGVFNVLNDDVIIYKKMPKISPDGPLLIVVDNSIHLLDYDKEDKELSLYEALIQDQSISDLNLLWRKEITEFDFADQLNNAFVSRDGSRIAFIGSDSIFLWSLIDFKEKPIECSDIKKVFSLVFTPDNTMLIAACDDGKIVSFDTTTGEKIGELFSQKKNAFDKNYAVAFSEDGIKFAASGTNLSNNNHLFTMQLRSDWEETIKKSLDLLDVIRNGSFDKIIMLKLLYDKSDGGKRPVHLTDTEKTVFDQLDNQLSEMLVNMGYVEFQEQIEPIESEVKQIPLPKKSLLEKVWNAGGYYWDYLNKILLGLPQSG